MTDFLSGLFAIVSGNFGISGTHRIYDFGDFFCRYQKIKGRAATRMMAAKKAIARTRYKAESIMNLCLDLNEQGPRVYDLGK
jgi:hypothetical protein